MATTHAMLRFAPLLPRITRSSLTNAINLTSPPPPPPPRSLKIHHPRVPPISASYNNNTTVPAMDRAISIIAYIHPFVSVLQFGNLLQTRFPLIASLISPFSPIRMAYKRDPRVEVLGFVILYLLTLTPNLSLFVRFHANQAVDLDVMLTRMYFLNKLIGTPTSGMRVRLLEYSNAAIFVLGCIIFIDAVLRCAEGRYLYLLPFSSYDIDVELQEQGLRSRHPTDLRMLIGRLVISAVFCMLSFMV